MNVCYKSYFVILFITMTSVVALKCPTNKECYCELGNHNQTASITCTMNNNSVFNIYIYYKTYDIISIDCINSSDLSDFKLNMTPLKKYHAVEIQNCNLPNTIKLIDIMRMLGAVHFKILTLKSHKISILKKHDLEGFENLNELTIINCKNLKLIETNTFDAMENLTNLHLIQNSLTELQSGIFDKLVALKYLSISISNLSSLPEDIFAKLKILNNLFLNMNNFISLPKDLLRNNIDLQLVTIMSNRKNLTLWDGLFSKLTNLQILMLQRNGLLTLPENLFWESFSLFQIDLSGNYIQSLPVKIFRDLTELKILSLNSNNLKVLPDYIFLNTIQLKTLDLSNNRITSISEQLFNGLHSLEELYMEQNHLKTISDYSFSYLSNLKIIKLSNNHLTLKSDLFDLNGKSISPFYNCSWLMEIYLANNSISKIFGDWNKHYKLHMLDLSYNNISSINVEDLLFLSNHIEVNLTHNKIQHIILDGIKNITKKETNSNIKILIENNPLKCDCDMYDFLSYIEHETSAQNIFQTELGSVTCYGPEELKDKRIDYLSSQRYSKNLTCKIKNTDSITVCSEMCDCFLKPHDKAFIFDCSNKNLTNVPNDIKEPNISSIQSFVTSINSILHFHLNFSHNQLTQMPDLKKLGLGSVNELSLSYNNISTISLNKLLKTIKVLELHNNNLSRIHPNVLGFWKNSTNLNHLTLYENPWECDCDAVELLNFTQTKYQILPKVSNIMCHRKNKSISEMTFYDFCPIDTKVIISTGAAIATAVTTAVALFGLIFGLYYKYQTHIKIWLFAHHMCLWFVSEEELDKNKLYDAFVSFSHKDEDFVENELVSKLESGPTPFKLCLHYRDWLAGDFIADNIARSVENSRRTIVVLSSNFLESVWGRTEFRAAHCQALNDGRARVIMILYGDIKLTNDLDPELEAYMSMNTYIKWGDPWFWDKLKYALPHQSRRPIRSPARREILDNYELINN